MAKKICELVMVFGSGAARAYLEDGIKALKKAISNGDGAIYRRQFNTTGEKEAYLQGLEDMNGWQDYAYIRPSDALKNESYFKKF